MRTRKLRAFAVFAAIVVFGFVFTGCNTEVTDKTIDVKSVTLDFVELSLTVGETETLTATVLPKDAKNKTVTWYSSNTTVATVGETTGLVTAKAKGQTTITVTAKNGKKAACVVTVNLAPDERKAVTGVVLSESELELEEGKTALLIAIVSPFDATDKAVTWSTSDAAKATVADGTVKAVAEGTATITVTTKDGNKTASCVVTVTAADPDAIRVTGVSLGKTSLILTIGGTVTETLIATVLPEDADDKTVRWASDKEDVATVEGGVVTAVGPGDAVITVTTEDGGFTAECDVTVKSPDSAEVPVSGVTLSETAYALNLNEEFTLTARVLPNAADDKTLTWTTGSASRASVTVDPTDNSKATVKGLGNGPVTITATAKNGVKGECVVTVGNILVTGVTLNKYELALDVGGKEKLIATVEPVRAFDPTITWSTTNATAATVASDGTVTGRAKGTATIKATSHNDIVAECAVTVSTVSVGSVTLSTDSLYVAVGGKKTLTATVLPEGAPNKALNWTSSDEDVATVSVDPDTGVATITGVGVGEYETVYIEEYWEEREVLLPITITVTSVEDGTKTTSCDVYVDLGMFYFMKPIQPTNPTFTMGSPPSEPGHYKLDEDEKPTSETDETQHSVTLTKGFHMGISQVFVKDYMQRMGFSPSLYFYYEELDYYDEWNEYQGICPIDNVTWYDAVEFCNKLSEWEGFTPVYTITNKVVAVTDYYGTIYHSITSATVTCNWNANGYRLPTEAEWEYACRAGTTTAYFTGDTIETLTLGNMGIATLGQAALMNPRGEAINGPQAYFEYAPNAWGLHNMHGSVEEWCWDWYGGDYGSAAQTNPTGPASGTSKVARGGSFMDYEVHGRSAARRAYAPDSLVDQGEWTQFISFRIVRNMQ